MYSDCGTNFKGASYKLSQAIHSTDQTKLNDYTKLNRIEWKFNPPGAANIGGAWERLIRSVITALFFVLKDHAASEEVLLTILVEV